VPASVGATSVEELRMTNNDMTPKEYVEEILQEQDDDELGCDFCGDRDCDGDCDYDDEDCCVECGDPYCDGFCWEEDDWDGD
jgi:hypothetical protein